MMKITILLLATFFSFQAFSTVYTGRIIYESHIEPITIKWGLSEEKADGVGGGLLSRVTGKMKYFDSQGNKKVLRPDDGAKEVQFFEGGDTVRFVTRKRLPGVGGTFNSNEKAFYYLEREGYLSWYSRFGTSSTGAPLIYSFLQREGEEIKQLIATSFNRRFVDYFEQDCPELAKKIENKEYYKKNVDEVVDFYYKNCYTE